MAKTQSYVLYADTLRKSILSGKYGWNGGIEGISELERQSGLKAQTIYRSLGILQGERLIIQRDKAFYVNLSPPVTMTGYVSMGEKYYNNLGTFEDVSLPAYLQSRFDNFDTGLVFRMQVSGKSSVSGLQPIQVSHRWYLIPLSVDEKIRLHNDPLYDPLWDKDEYATQLQSHDEVGARNATAEECSQLNLPDGTSVCCLLEVIRGMDGKILMIQEVTIAPCEKLIFSFAFLNKPSDK